MMQTGEDYIDEPSIGGSEEFILERVVSPEIRDAKMKELAQELAPIMLESEVVLLQILKTTIKEGTELDIATVVFDCDTALMVREKPELYKSLAFLDELDLTQEFYRKYGTTFDDLVVKYRDNSRVFSSVLYGISKSLLGLVAAYEMESPNSLAGVDYDIEDLLLDACRINHPNQSENFIAKMSVLFKFLFDFDDLNDKYFNGMINISTEMEELLTDMDHEKPNVARDRVKKYLIGKFFTS